MRILFITYHGWNYGGAETYLYTVKDELIKSGHDVRIFASDFGREEHEIKADYIFETAKSRTQNLLRMVYNTRSLYALRHALTDFKPDIVHINSLSTELSPSIFSTLKNYKTVMTIHSTNTFYTVGSLKGLNAVYEPVRTAIRRKLIRNVDVFTCPSNAVRKYIPDNILPLKVLYIGIKPIPSSPIKYFNNILYVGRIARDKGVDVLIRAMSDVVKYNRGYKLTLVGEGPMLAECQALVNKLKLDSAITFVGHVSHDNIVSYLQKSTIVVMPSVYEEPFGLSGVEAMYAGRPVIASDIGGIPEWLDDICGKLVKPGEENDLARELISMLSDKAALKRRAVLSIKKAQQFSISRHTKQLQLLYMSLIND